MNKNDQVALSYLISIVCQFLMWIVMLVSALRGDVAWVLFTGFTLLLNVRSIEHLRREFRRAAGMEVDR